MTPAYIRCGGEGLFVRPSVTLTLSYQTRGQSSDARPLAHIQTLSAQAQNLRNSPVVNLFKRGRPSAIARLVIAAVVDAIKGCAFWTRPHVAQERLKRIQPLTAHGYAASAVVVPLRVRFVRASLFRRGPAIEFAGDAQPVCARGGVPQFISEATTGSRITGAQFTQSTHDLISAITQSLYSAVVKTVWGVFSNNGQSPVSLAHYIHARHLSILPLSVFS